MIKILIVEDDLKVMNSINRLLSRNGYKVFTAQTVDDALEIIDNETLDLIISDIMMKPRNGYELAKELSVRPRMLNLPLIFLTAKTEYEDFRMGMEFGAADYLMKPFSNEQLLKAIQTQLDKADTVKKLFGGIIKSFRGDFPHHLRTPLVSILGFADIIRQYEDDEQFREIAKFGNKIYASAKTLHKNIEKMLDYAEIATNILSKEYMDRIRNEFNYIEIGETIEYLSAANWSENGKRAKNDTIVKYAQIKTYDIFFQRMLSELLGNAFRYARDGSIVKIRGEVDNDNYVISIVNQSASKIDVSELVKKRAINRDSNNLKISNGMGLGLEIAKSLAELLKCRLSFDVENRELVTCRIEVPQI